MINLHKKDLDMGFNQIKVRLSRQEYGSATFIRLDAPSFFQLAADENARLSIGGAGQGTFPVLQSYTGMMPDGTLRNFLSLDELKATLAKANADAVSAVQSRNVNSATGSVSRTQPPEPEQPQGGASACPPSKPACSPKPPVATTVTMENRRLALHLDPGECLPRVGDAVVIVDGAGCVVSRLTVDSVGVCRFKAVGKVPTDLRSGNYRVMPDRPNGH